MEIFAQVLHLCGWMIVPQDGYAPLKSAKWTWMTDEYPAPWWAEPDQPNTKPLPPFEVIKGGMVDNASRISQSRESGRSPRRPDAGEGRRMMLDGDNIRLTTPEARVAIHQTARYLKLGRNYGLFNHSKMRPLKEAIARASGEDIGMIKLAADFLAELQQAQESAASINN